MQAAVFLSQTVGAAHLMQKLEPLMWLYLVGQMQVKVVGSRMWLVGQETQVLEEKLKKAGGLQMQ